MWSSCRLLHMQNHAEKKTEKVTFEDFTLGGAMGARVGLQAYLMGATGNIQGTRLINHIFLIIVSLALLLYAH